jgi:hypothetical protein
VFETECGTVVLNTYSRGPLQISDLGSNSDTLQIQQDNPAKCEGVNSLLPEYRSSTNFLQCVNQFFFNELTTFIRAIH